MAKRDEEPEVISRYPLRDAIEDGTHVCVGFIETTFGKVRIIATNRFLNTLSPYNLLHLFLQVFRHMHPQKPNWIVFYPEPTKPHLEDEGRTLITFIEGLEKKVYASLDDYGQHYVLTLFLAEEY